MLNDNEETLIASSFMGDVDWTSHSDEPKTAIACSRESGVDCMEQPVVSSLLLTTTNKCEKESDLVSESHRSRCRDLVKVPM